MVFPIERTYQKGSKIETIISKIRQIWHLCCKVDELHPNFSQIAIRIPYCFNAQVNGNSILQKLLWFEQKMD